MTEKDKMLCELLLELRDIDKQIEQRTHELEVLENAKKIIFGLGEKS